MSLLSNVFGSITLVVVSIVSVGCKETRACRADTDAGCFGACPSPTAVCDERSGQWVGCLADEHCGGATPVCSSTLHECIACATNVDCAESAHGSVCDVATGQCHACVSNADCGEDAPVCSPDTHTCVGCSNHADCATSAQGRVCDTQAGTCHRCLSNYDCGGAGLVCSPDTRECFGCNVDADCAASVSGEICDVATKTCRGCSSNAECRGSKSLCSSTTGACVACLTNVDCRGSSAGAICDGATQTCRGCLAHADCAGTPATPSCNAATGRCVACTADTEAAVCGASSCNRLTSTCSRTTRGSLALCAPCQADSECVAGSHCIDHPDDHPATTTGRCLPDTPASGCGDHATNRGLLPYSVGRFRASVDGASVPHCTPPQSVSCEAIVRFGARCSAPEGTQPSLVCGSFARQDGVCVNPSSGPDLCSYACSSSADCPASATCATSGAFEHHCKPR